METPVTVTDVSFPSFNVQSRQSQNILNLKFPLYEIFPSLFFEPSTPQRTLNEGFTILLTKNLINIA
jgi:hypothetical protein